jgi:hypothetical protein
MADIVTLYAWVAPIYDNSADHTWVTTYDNTNSNTQYPNIQAVEAAHQSYWYCWGMFHGKSTGSLGTLSGDLTFAKCLVTPNVVCTRGRGYPADGTIYYYGIDGVCHQLANQVLYATGAGVNPTGPLTVQGARGYWASSHLYGTYGTTQSEWQQQIATCGTQQVAVAAAAGGLP